MRYRKLIGLVLCIALLSFNIVLADGSTFNLDGAIDKAIEGSSSIKAQDNSYEDLRESNDDTGEGSMAARDFLNVDARFTYLDSKKDRTIDEQLEYQGYKLAFGKPMTEEQKLSYYIARDISPSYMTYYMKANRNTRELIANQIRLSMYEQYNNLMKLKDSIDIQTRLVKNLERNNEQAQLKLSIGKLSKVDARLVEIEYLKSKLELSKLQRNLDMVLMNINKMAGEPVNKKYTSYGTDNMAAVAAIKSYEQYLSDAMKNRSEILNAEIGYKLQKMEYDLTLAAYPLESDVHNRDAKYDLDNAYNTLETAKIDLEIEISSAYSDLERKLKSWESAAKSYESAKANYESAAQRYSMNMITENALSTANISLAQAEMQLKNSRRDLWIQQLKMDYASGLGPGIRILTY